jgi:hypothetical protein
MRSNVWLANRQRNARTNNISSGSTAKCNQCRVFTRRCAPRRTHISAMQEQHRTQTATTTLSLSCVRKHTLPFNLCVCSTRMHSQAHSLQSKRGCCQQAANPVFYNQEEKAHQTTPPAVTEPRPPSTPNPTMQRDEMRCMLTAASHKTPTARPWAVKCLWGLDGTRWPFKYGMLCAAAGLCNHQSTVNSQHKV